MGREDESDVKLAMTRKNEYDQRLTRILKAVALAQPDRGAIVTRGIQVLLAPPPHMDWALRGGADGTRHAA